MKGGGGRLPSEYQQIEYLEGTRTQYINANIPHDTQDPNRFYLTIEVDCKNYAVQDTMVFGTYSYSYLNRWGTSVQASQFGSGNNLMSGTLVSGVRHVIKAEYTPTSATYYVDGVEVGNYQYTARDLGFSSIIFGGNYRNRLDIYDLLVTKSFRRYHFIPCYRKSDNKPGMYDIENNVFYTNDGTGEFIVGPDVN